MTWRMDNGDVVDHEGYTVALLAEHPDRARNERDIVNAQRMHEALLKIKSRDTGKINGEMGPFARIAEKVLS